MFFATQAIPGRFFSLFLQAHGLNSSEIGFILSAGNLIAIFSTPFFSVISDKSKSRSTVVLWLVISSMFSIMLHAIALPRFDVIPNNIRFYYLLFTRCLFCFVNRPVLTIITAICVVQLRDYFGANGPSKYGDERMWGTISWGIVSLMVGISLDIFVMNMIPLYVGNSLMAICFLISIYLFDRDQRKCNIEGKTEISSTSFETRQRVKEANNIDKADDDKTQNKNIFGGSGQTIFFKTIKSVIFEEGFQSISFFVLISVLSSGVSAVTMLQFLYFHNELNASGLVCGIAVVITVLFEAPLFAKASHLLQTYGTETMILIASFSYGIRAIGYSLVPQGWYVLLLEPLHGVTFACMQTAGVAHVARYAPKGADATAQAVFMMVRTISGVIGVGLGGQIMHFFNGRTLFATFGTVVLSISFLFIATRYFIQKRYSFQNIAMKNNEKIVEEERTPLINLQILGNENGDRKERVYSSFRDSNNETISKTNVSSISSLRIN